MYKVQITRQAEEDVNSIIDYLLSQEALAAVRELWSEFEKAFTSLDKFPLRGHVPPELSEYPDKRIREVHASVYRIIYRVTGKQVHVLAVFDGRRDLQSILVERALRINQ